MDREGVRESGRGYRAREKKKFLKSCNYEKFRTESAKNSFGAKIN